MSFCGDIRDMFLLKTTNLQRKYMFSTQNLYLGMDKEWLTRYTLTLVTILWEYRNYVSVITGYNLVTVGARDEAALDVM